MPDADKSPAIENASTAGPDLSSAISETTRAEAAAHDAVLPAEVQHPHISTAAPVVGAEPKIEAPAPESAAQAAAVLQGEADILPRTTADRDIPKSAEDRIAWQLRLRLGFPMVYRAAEGRQQQISAEEYHAAMVTKAHDDGSVNLRVFIDGNGSFDVENVPVWGGGIYTLPPGHAVPNGS